MGRYSQKLAAACGDFVVRRADGLFAYHLATVVDDADAGVNQVVRGADLIASTPRQIYLQRLLGLASPAYVHLPLVTDPSGAKLSKRDTAVSLFSGKGLMPDAAALLLGALEFLGQDVSCHESSSPPKEILTSATRIFDPEKIPTATAPFRRVP